jgi:hypothetical protein
MEPNVRQPATCKPSTPVTVRSRVSVRYVVRSAATVTAFFSHYIPLRLSVCSDQTKPCWNFSIVCFYLRAGVAQSVQCLTTDRTAEVRSPTGQRIFPLTSESRPALGPTQPPVQWVTGALSPGVKRGRGVMLTTHPLLVPRTRKRGSCTSSHPKRLHGV